MKLSQTSMYLIILLIKTNLSMGINYYVSVDGNDLNSGCIENPLRTIQAAANVAQPGDVITIFEGVYRERIDPPRGGKSFLEPIIYQAAPGEHVVIKGSEIASGWELDKGDVWRISYKNEYFGAFNPFANEIRSDWFLPLDKEHTTGAVYINNRMIAECDSLEDVYQTDGGMRWFAKSDNTGTHIWANFSGMDPNNEQVEINKRRTVIYPSKPGINFITIRGLHLTQAANPWSPPTREQIGLIGVNWSKGWVIENNVISHARCAGLTLGKYHDRLDGLMKYSYNSHYQTVKRVIKRGDWTRENIGHHLVRNNLIFDCEQAGIVGSHGGSFSVIEDNQIYNINMRGWWDGFEQAGIKLHAAVDTIIRNNLIHHSQRGIWLDWMSQGARVSGNILFDNKKHDFFTEVNHGPLLVDNNFFLSDVSIKDVSQGGAFVHNLCTGSVQSRTSQGSDRYTQYFLPHSCTFVGEENIRDGDDRFINNILLEHALDDYEKQTSGNLIEGNVYIDASLFNSKKPIYNLIQKNNEIELIFYFDRAWYTTNRFICSSETLGEAVVTQQRFDSPEGQAIHIDTDYFGNNRPIHPFPGPYEIKETEHRIKLWPK